MARRLPYSLDEPWSWRYIRPDRERPKLSDWDPERTGLPPKRFWAGYGDSINTYLASGRRDTATMLGMLLDLGYAPSPGDSVLDFGCHVGRMLRWLPTDQEVSYWGVDTDACEIRFCEENFPSPPFRFAVTSHLPHLPFADGTFALAIAGSVFTHINELSMAWFLELHRVIRPGGYLYLTIHDQHTIQLLQHSAANSWLAGYVRSSGVLHKVPLDAFEMFSVGRGPYCQVFHRRDWLVQRLQGLYYLEGVHEEAYGSCEAAYQTALVMRAQRS